MNQNEPTLESASGFERRAWLRHLTIERAELEERRNVLTLASRGFSAQSIARLLRLSQSKVEQILATASNTPDDLSASPTEIILAAYLDKVDRAELVRWLSAVNYTFPRVVGYDGVTESTWREVEVAVARGLLSDAEFAEVCAAVNPPSTGEAGWNAEAMITEAEPSDTSNDSHLEQSSSPAHPVTVAEGPDFSAKLRQAFDEGAEIASQMTPETLLEMSQSCSDRDRENYAHWLAREVQLNEVRAAIAKAAANGNRRHRYTQDGRKALPTWVLDKLREAGFKVERIDQYSTILVQW